MADVAVLMSSYIFSQEFRKQLPRWLQGRIAEGVQRSSSYPLDLYLKKAQEVFTQVLGCFPELEGLEDNKLLDILKILTSFFGVSFRDIPNDVKIGRLAIFFKY